MRATHNAWFWFDGVFSWEKGALMTAWPTRYSPALRGKEKEVAGRDGDVYVTDGTFGTVEVNQEFAIRDITEVEAEKERTEVDRPDAKRSDARGAVQSAHDSADRGHGVPRGLFFAAEGVEKPALKREIVAQDERGDDHDRERRRGERPEPVETTAVAALLHKRANSDVNADHGGGADGVDDRDPRGGEKSLFSLRGARFRFAHSSRLLSSPPLYHRTHGLSISFY